MMKRATTTRGIFASLAVLTLVLIVISCKKGNPAPSLFPTSNGSGASTNVISPCGDPVVSNLIARQNIPIPGQLPFAETDNPYTQTATLRVALADLPPCYIIPAHAEVHKVVNGVAVQEETAWSYGTPFQDTDCWGWVSEYCTQVCE